MKKLSIKEKWILQNKIPAALERLKEFPAKSWAEMNVNGAHFRIYRRGYSTCRSRGWYGDVEELMHACDLL